MGRIIILITVLALSFNLFAAKKIPLRSEILPQDKWDISDLYQGEKEWTIDFEQVKQLMKQVEQCQLMVTTNAVNLFYCLDLRDQLNIKAEKVYTFSQMKWHQNLANNKYQRLSAQATTLLAQVGTVQAYFAPAILKLTEGQLKLYLLQNPKLKRYQQYFNVLWRVKKYTLSAPEEKILARLGDFASSPDTIFHTFTDADLEYPVIKDEKNREVQLTSSRFYQYIYSSDPRVRKEAYQAFHRPYKKYANTISKLYVASIKKDIFYASSRGYESTLQAYLYPNHIPLAVYHNLIQTIHKYLPLLHRYVELKKKVLKLKKINYYDLYVPMFPNKGLSKVSYEDAKKIVRSGLKPLGAEYLALVKKAYDDRWVDVYENKGKRSGAYSWGTYSSHPVILLNYAKTFHDVSTLTHEMGHAIHRYYSKKTQPYIYYECEPFLAEVASTTNETLLLRYMLKKAKDPDLKLFLLNTFVEQIRTTVFRQVMFAEFEMLVHRASEKGEALTAKKLTEMYHALVTKYYGPQMIVEKDIAEWARIPHFYTAFYVYQYATGYSAAIAFAQMIGKDPVAAQRYIDKFLKAGSSDYPINILKNAGVDMSTATPIEKTMEFFKSVLDRIESTYDKVKK